MTPGYAVRAPRDVFYRVVAIARRMKRYWWMLVVAAVVGAAAAVVVPRTLLPPVYMSETVLLYREVIQAGQLLGSDYRGESATEVGQRLREMLLARPTLEALIKEFNLYPDIVASRGIIDAVDEMRLRIDARVRQGETFYIKFEGNDPNKVYQVTKRLADSLVAQSKRYRNEEAEATRTFLEAQMSQTDQELKLKEEELARFLAQHPEFAQDMATVGIATAGASIRAAEKEKRALNAPDGETDPRILALRRQAMRLRQQLQNPMAAPAPSRDLPPALAAALADAQQGLVQAQQELADRKMRYTQAHPDVITAEARVRAAQQRVTSLQNQANMAAGVASAAPADPEARRGELQQQLRRVEGAIASYRQSKTRGREPPKEGSTQQGQEGAESSWVVELETKWATLTRQLNELRERNQQIQARYFRASIISNVESSTSASGMAIIDPAYQPLRPAKMGPRRVGAASMGAVLFLGLALMLTAALLTDRLYDEVDLRRLELGPIAHVVPKASLPKGKRYA